MATPSRDPSQNKYTEQNILNTSFDETYGVLAVELLGEDTNVLRRLQADSSGNLKVNVVAGGGGGTQYTEGDTDATITGTASMVEGAGNALAVLTQPLTDTQLRATAVPVSLTSTTVTGTVAVTNAGLTALNGAISGTEVQVDVLTMPTVTVTATNLDVQSGGADLATTTQAASIQTAVELIDDAIYVDDADWTADTSKHALAGSVTQVAPTANTDGDTTPLISDALRQLRVAALESDLATAGTSHVKKYYTNAGAVTDGIIWSPAAGKRWFLTHLSINVSAAATVTIEDDLAAGDSAVYKAEFAANSGVVLTFPEVPMFSGEDAADLLVTTSAGNVYVTAVGYEV